MLSIKKTSEILKDKSFIEYLEKIYDLKITKDFIIFRSSQSIYKDGSFKAIDCMKMYTITARTDKNFDLHMSRRDFEVDYKEYIKKNRPKSRKVKRY